MSTAELTLPSQEDLELTDYKLGTTTSDLDWIRSNVESCLKGDVTTVEEYLYRKAEGFENPAGETVRYDRHELARLVVFATDALHDAESIKDDALAIQEAALALYHEQRPAVDWKGLVAAWHREELADDA